MNTPRDEIIQLFLRNSDVLKSWLWRYYPLPEALVFKHKNKINISSYSYNIHIVWTDFLLQSFESSFIYIEGFHYNPTVPWSEEIIDKYCYEGQLDTDLSNCPFLPWSYEFMKKYKDGINWHYLILNKAVPWTQRMFVDFNLFDENLSDVNSPGLWTEAFILKYKDKFNWYHLCRNPHLPWSESLIDNLKPVWENIAKIKNWDVSVFWSAMSENTGLPWSIELIEKFGPNEANGNQSFDWYRLSNNEAIPWSDEFLEKYCDKLEWSNLKINKGVSLSMEQFEKYASKILWVGNELGITAIANNPLSPWSMRLKKKDEDHLNSQTPNRSMIWTLEYLLDREQDYFDSLSEYLPDDNTSSVIWADVFAPILDDNLVDELLAMPIDPVKFHKSKMSIFKGDINSPILELVETILAIEIKTSERSYNISESKNTIDKLKLCIVSIAHKTFNAPEANTRFLYRFENDHNPSLNRMLVRKMKPIKQVIIHYFNKETGDVDFVRNLLDELNVRVYSVMRRREPRVHEGFLTLFENGERDLRSNMALGELLMKMEAIEAFC